MDVAALVLWIFTAVGGIALAGIWLQHRGPAQHRTGISRISPARLGAHFAFAATGLGLWVTHLATDSNAVGWVASAFVPLVAALGLLMFITWLAGRGAAAANQRPAEQHFPVSIVAAHGLFAVCTLAVVVVALVV